MAASERDVATTQSMNVKASAFVQTIAVNHFIDCSFGEGSKRISGPCWMR